MPRGSGSSSHYSSRSGGKGGTTRSSHVAAVAHGGYGGHGHGHGGYGGHGHGGYGGHGHGGYGGYAHNYGNRYGYRYPYASSTVLPSVYYGSVASPYELITINDNTGLYDPYYSNYVYNPSVIELSNY